MLSPQLRVATALPAAVLAVTFILSACTTSGSGAGAEAATNPSVTFGVQASTTPGLTGTGTGASTITAPTTGVPSGGQEVPVGGPAISIVDFAFGPATLTVPAGSTVTWTNKDGEPHTVVANDGSFHSPAMDTNGTFSFTFSTPGSFDYICSIHPFMHATVVVTK